MVRVKLMSSWIACTRKTEALRAPEEEQIIAEPQLENFEPEAV